MEKKVITAKEMFDSNALIYQEKYMDVSKYTEAVVFYCEALPTDTPEILELACGPGNLTRALLEHKPTLKILATDTSPAMLSLAINNNPSIKTLELDMNKLNSLEGKFDGVICGFGLPYLSHDQMKALVGSASGLLKTHGVLYVSTMSDRYEKSGHYGPSTGGNTVVQMYFHPANEVSDALKRAGFDVIYEGWPDKPDEADQPRDVVFIGRKQ